MPVLIFLAGFAAAHAVVMYASVSIGVGVLGWYAPEVGSAAVNLQLMRQILPVEVWVATLLAAIGLLCRGEWPRFPAIAAITAGFAAGTLVAIALFAIPAALEISAGTLLPGTLAAALFVAFRVFVVVLPAVLAYVVVGVVERRTRRA